MPIRTLARLLRSATRPFGFDIVRYAPPTVQRPALQQLQSAPTSETVARLAKAFPFPTPPMTTKPLLINCDGGGREIVDRLIHSHQVGLILEIGTFFGGSALRWLETSKEVVVICVDPWADNWAADFATNCGFPEFREQLNAKDGFFHTFLKNVENFRDRIIPTREPSPDVLLKLFLMGVKPDLVYLDGNKTAGDLITAHQLWPKAILTGDDWAWNPEMGYPMRQVVTTFAAEFCYEVESQMETWHIIKPK